MLAGAYPMRVHCSFSSRDADAMALVKKSTLGARGKTPVTASPDLPTSRAIAAPKPRRAARRGSSVGDRLDAATQELASGLAESASAASELQRAIDQISAGAEEAAGAAQESSGLISALAAGFAGARERAEASRRQSELVQNAFLETNTQIDGSVAAIELNARRQTGSVEVIISLETSAESIGEIGLTVADISD